jgi:hypothetical protein
LQSLQTPEWEEVASMDDNTNDTFLRFNTSFGICSRSHILKYLFSILQTKRAFVDVPIAVVWDIVLQIVQSWKIKDSSN